MTEFSYTVHDDNGIHARPAGLLVSQAQTVRICCEGDAEAEAAQALEALMRAQF